MHPGWCEHDPEEIYTSVKECAKEVISRNFAMLVNRDGSSNVKAIGITNQRETTVAWNRKTGEPLHNAVVWLDTRTADVVKDLQNKHGAAKLEEMRQRCGLPLNTYFSGSKIRWLLDNSPAVHKVAQSDPSGETLCFSTIDTWLIAVSCLVLELPTIWRGRNSPDFAQSSLTLATQAAPC